MKKFFGEFKKFITRGNVLDMAVGVIVGGAFTGIVNGLSNYILKPIINWLLALVLGQQGLSGAITMLSPSYKLDAAGLPTTEIDLASSIYIDWGAFISAIINFLLIAIVLFSIVKFMNKIKDGNGKLTESIKKLHLDKDEKKELKEAGVNIKDKKAVKAYFEEKERLVAEEAAKAEEEAKLAEEEAKKHTTEALLEDIKALLQKQIENK